MTGYVVWHWSKGFLSLDGPFAYPRWLSSSDGATRLSWIQAHAYAAFLGGEVRS